MRIPITLALGCLPLVALGQGAAEHDRRATAHHDKKQYREAIREWTRAIALRPTYHRYDKRGQAKHELKDYPGAIADYTQALKHDAPRPDRGVTLGRRGQCRFWVLDFKEALFDVRWAIKLRQGQEFDDYDVRGHCYLFQGRYALAVADFSQALKLAKGWQRSYALRSRGVAHLLNRKKVWANQDFKAALKLEPKSHYLAAWIWRSGSGKQVLEQAAGRNDLHGSTAKFFLGRIDAARYRREARGFQKQNPRSLEMAHGYVGLKEERWDRAKALPHFRACVRLSRLPFGTIRTYARARVYEADRGDPLWPAELKRIKELSKQKRDSEAVAALTQALDRGRLNTPQQLLALLYRSNFRTRLSRFREAIADLDEARRVNKASGKTPLPDYRKDYAELLSRRAAEKAKKGNLFGANRDLTGAILFKPNRTSLYVQRAEYRLQRGDKAGCRKDALRAQRLDPNNKKAKELLAQTAPEAAKTAARACTGCNKSLRPDDKFCSNCGKKTGPPTCGGCTKTLRPNDKFCSNCGKKVGG